MAVSALEVIGPAQFKTGSKAKDQSAQILIASLLSEV